MTGCFAGETASVDVSRGPRGGVPESENAPACSFRQHVDMQPVQCNMKSGENSPGP